MIRNAAVMVIGILCLICLFGSCGEKDTHKPVRSVYYWSTAFSLDSLKRDFLHNHGIERIYVRYFDVVQGGSGFPVPNATIRIDSVPGVEEWEIVPVVFILPDALDCDAAQLAEKVLGRVKQMSETHGMGSVGELQIDCDWTRSTRQAYFNFMAELKKLTGSEGIVLSSTIRLHQLAQSPPPADKGVLMVYNTGDLRQLDKEKPILDPDDVEPYLKYIGNYNLPLSSAYPIFRWELLFRNGDFVDIVHGSDDVPVLDTDTIVSREPLAGDIMQCRRAIEARNRGCADEIILFDLNNYNINRYDYETFEDFYN